MTAGSAGSRSSTTWSLITVLLASVLGHSFTFMTPAAFSTQPGQLDPQRLARKRRNQWHLLCGAELRIPNLRRIARCSKATKRHGLRKRNVKEASSTAASR